MLGSAAISDMAARLFRFWLALDQEVHSTMRIAILGGRWADADVEGDVLGVLSNEIVIDPGQTAQAIIEAAGDADVILAGPRPPLDANTLDQLSCRGIVRYGVGYENVDVAAAHQRGITVAYVPDYGTDAVAFHSVSLALAALRRIPLLDRQLKSGSWDFGPARPLHLPAALTVGLVGFGRIGRAAAALFSNLGFGRTVVFDEYVDSVAAGFEALSLAELLAQADVVSLHAPGAGDGTPLIGPDEIALMKPESVIVNTARGALIDTTALIAGLREGRPAVAALDVFNPEPPDPSTFADVLDQVIMTPHMAWYTEETEVALRTKTAEEAKRILNGEKPNNPVPISGETS
jgi:D-3-phosphoglycerate dehydrogenase